MASRRHPQLLKTVAPPALELPRSQPGVHVDRRNKFGTNRLILGMGSGYGSSLRIYRAVEIKRGTDHDPLTVTLRDQSLSIVSNRRSRVRRKHLPQWGSSGYVSAGDYLQYRRTYLFDNSSTASRVIRQSKRIVRL